MKLLLLLVFKTAFVELLQAQPAISKKKFYLFLLAGQSNMAGRGAVDSIDTIPDAHVWMLNKNDQWQLAVEPLHFDKPAITGVGPGFAFAKKMASLDTNIYIGLIPCAVGGSPIDAWQPGEYYEATKSHPYDDAIRRAKTAMQAGKLKGILWHQGESDSDSLHALVYHDKMPVLIKRFRADLKKKSLLFVVGTLPDFYLADHPYAKLINEAIIQLPATVKKTAVVNTSGLSHKGDKVHFNSSSAREVGVRYAGVYQTLLKSN